MPSRRKGKFQDSPPRVSHPKFKSTRTLYYSIGVFLLGAFFTWQIFDLIVNRRLPTMQETMEDAASKVYEDLDRMMDEHIGHLHVLRQLLTYEPMLTQEFFTTAASDLVKKAPEWKWLHYEFYNAAVPPSAPFVAKGFEVSQSLNSLLTAVSPEDKNENLVAAETYAYPLSTDEAGYFLVRAMIKSDTKTEGMLEGVMDLRTLLQPYFAAHKQEIYDYVISIEGKTLATDLGYHDDLDRDRPYQMTQKLKWGRASIRIDIWPKPYYLNNRALAFNMDLAGHVIIGMGLLFSAAMGLLAWSIVSRTQFLKIQVARRTAELSKTNTLLQNKNDEIENFIYTISHDLKSPIVSIQGFSSILKEEFGKQLGENACSYLARIQSNAVRMYRMIQDLLELSRIGHVKDEIEKVDVRHLVEDIVQSHHNEIEKKHIQVHVDESLPTVVFSKMRIQQVFDNLISNAIKYVDEKKQPEIRVEADGQGLEDGFYQFRVRDNGIGIDKSYHDKIFQIFQRVPTEANIEGTGVGLSIVKKIVEQKGGTVSVDSSPGLGSTFIFTIPKSPELIAA